MIKIKTKQNFLYLPKNTVSGNFEARIKELSVILLAFLHC